ncbi:hypothetical protein [Aquimarina aquimarini]|uniref:hypothetical protein n=1 Tax=Aquimarina aquimarini TaxID=1191734 RepID=UPI000D5514D2|nr:hypothetical protein [Aquimarina aquimarini]
MKKILLLIFIFTTLSSYTQSLSKTRIIYERKDQIVMNNGKQYKILVNKPFYLVSDTSIKKHKQFTDHVLRLNRVLIIQSDNEYKQLIEWVKEDMTLYESRELSDIYLKENNLSDSIVLPKD